MIVFRADASVHIGTGHVMRCLTLADALREQGHACHFICREHPGNLVDTLRQRGFPVHALHFGGETADEGADDPAHAQWLGASWETDARQSSEIIRELDPTWIVVDHYALDVRWEAAVRPQRARLLVIDDLADRPHEADLLLDQNLGRAAEDYAELMPESCRLLIGPSYALLRPEFARLREESLRRRRTPRLKRLLVTMGGVDKDNATGKVLNALRDCPLPDDAEIEVVVGSNAPWLETVRRQSATMPWPTRVQVDVPDMAQRMVDADLAIGAAGGTSWERCCLGLPTLIVVLAENQKTNAEALAGSGACIYLGDVQDVKKLPDGWGKWINVTALGVMSKANAAVTDGKGTARLCQHMGFQTAVMSADTSGILRPLQASDLEMIREWRNHYDVCRYMYTQHTVSHEEHQRWFEHATSNSDRHLMIFEKDGVPSGFVNVTIVDPMARRAEWGFYLAPDAERGSGSLLGQLTLAYVFKDLEQHKLCGEALAYNYRSIRFHERLGFHQEARLRDHHFDGNQYYDVIGFGLIASEWLRDTGDSI